MKKIIKDEKNNWPIYADFNAVDEDGAIRIFTPHLSMDRQNLDVNLVENSYIWISDGDIETIGTLNLRDNIWVAIPDDRGISNVDASSQYHIKNLLIK